MTTRLRPKLIHIYLHEEEDKFLKKYASENLLSVSELIRGWMHEVMKQEGYQIKEPFIPKLKGVKTNGNKKKRK